MDKNLESLMHYNETETISLRVIKNARMAIIPQVTRELLNLQPEDYVHVKYIMPSRSPIKINKSKILFFADYQQVNKQDGINIHPEVRKLLKLRDGDYFNVRLKKVYFSSDLD